MDTEDYLGRLQNDMELRNLAKSTRHSYFSCVRKFLEFSSKPLEETNEEDVRAFILHLRNDLKLEPRTVNVYNAAICYFYTFTLDRALNRAKVPKMKTTISVPEVLTSNELKRLMDATTDIKYKAIFSLAYGSGLRISEILNLHDTDIRSDSMQIFVRKSKRNKERYTVLGKSTLYYLRRYYKEYDIKHMSEDGLLFIGDSEDGAICQKTVNSALKMYLEKAKIRKSKNVTMHTLRHSFATLMLQSGADIFLIKDLLGHSSITSTAIYMHVVVRPEQYPGSPADL